MYDFDNLCDRHGNGWVWKLIEGAERARGIKPMADATYEDRWNFLMQEPLQASIAQRAA